jgi:hypothetical protein
MFKKYLQLYPLRALPQRMLRSFMAYLTFFAQNPLRIFYAVLVALIFYYLIYWLINAGTTTPFMLNENIPGILKMSVFASYFSSAFLLPQNLTLFLLVIISAMQGIIVTALIFMIRRQKNVAKSIGSTSVVSVVAVLGLGCAACGTSLITPLLAALFASSAVAIAEQISPLLIAIAMALTIISLHTTGYKLSQFLTNKT